MLTTEHLTVEAVKAELDGLDAEHQKRRDALDADHKAACIALRTEIGNRRRGCKRLLEVLTAEAPKEAR